MPVADLDDVGELDLAIDGADEIDAGGRMIKGGAANLLWGKIIAVASVKMVALVDESKVVLKLGKFPLPVEVPFGWRTTVSHLEKNSFLTSDGRMFRSRCARSANSVDNR